MVDAGLDKLRVMAAPLQGMTDEAWRMMHRRVYGESIERYFTPFLRVEKSVVRSRDLRGLRSEMNEGVPVTPQVIFNTVEEFTTLVDAINECGYREVDLNLGCPFPPQVHHGRGSALLRNPGLLDEVTWIMRECYPHLEFSVKMRLGVERPDEWRGVIASLNAMGLRHVTVHPRVAVQQYGGELFHDEFRRFCEECRHPVVFNGDMTSLEAIDRVGRDYPGVKTVMVGRGLLMRPSLAAEYAGGEEWDRPRRIENVMRLHRMLWEHYSATLSGESHLLQKMKPFWEYLEDEVGRKIVKQIRKAVTAAKYQAAVAAVG